MKVTYDQLKKVMMAPGDGIVTERSLAAATQSKTAGLPSLIGSTGDKLICEEHNKLAANPRIQDYVFGILNGKGTTAKSGTEK